MVLALFAKLFVLDGLREPGDAAATVSDMELRDVDKPVVGDEDLLVRAHAAGVDPGVWHLMTGLPYPVRILGYVRARADKLAPKPATSPSSRPRPSPSRA